MKRKSTSALKAEKPSRSAAKAPRGLTIRERCRIQSFPDSFEICGGTVQGRLAAAAENGIPSFYIYPEAVAVRRLGGTGLRFRLAESAKRGDKNVGAFCPDIVAWKDGRFLLFENKSRDTVSDYAKQSAVKRDVTLQGQLAAAYPGRDLRDVSVALAFSPPFIHGDLAQSCGIDLVLTVADDLSVSTAYVGHNVGNSGQPPCPGDLP